MEVTTKDETVYIKMSMGDALELFNRLGEHVRVKDYETGKPQIEVRTRNALWSSPHFSRTFKHRYKSNEEDDYWWPYDVPR